MSFKNNIYYNYIYFIYSIIYIDIGLSPAFEISVHTPSIFLLILLGILESSIDFCSCSLIFRYFFSSFFPSTFNVPSLLYIPYVLLEVNLIDDILPFLICPSIDYISLRRFIVFVVNNFINRIT